jgi:type I restriction enzyme M protein
VAIKKSELYSSLWHSCDELRAGGGMDASQYKDYVLVVLFLKYVSDKAASRPDYDLVVPHGGSFADMVALKGDPEIGDKINKIIGCLADANDSLRGAIDVADFADEALLGKGKEMVDTLSHLVAIFQTPELDFTGNSADGDDLLGDAYEYLMRNFATESGKSKGQFYTPAEVSRVIAQVIGLGSATSPTQTIYDPTCGSGSLLLKAHDEARSKTGLDLAIYGQEKDNATSGLARMNMVLHDATTAEIWQGNTLSQPHWHDASGGLKTFDFVVANPPFSTKAWANGFDPEHDLFKRFPYGQPPAKNGDYAFLLHLLASMKSTGSGAIILPHGVLFRGNSEAVIRRELVGRGSIKGIIGLPANLFYGTGIPACIIVLDKANAATRNGIFMMDASRGFIKDGNKNRLRAKDMRRIVDAFAGGFGVPGFARFVPNGEIEANDFNLSLSRYIDPGDSEDIQDIDGHLRGGIPDRDLDALDRYWQVLPGVRETLFESAGRPGYSRLRVQAQDVSATVSEHPDFRVFGARIQEAFESWQSTAEPLLSSLDIGGKPKALIATLAEAILHDFQTAPLLDPYDLYQCLLDYWTETLQDDTYLISDLGWLEAAKPRPIVATTGRKSKVEPDFAVGKKKLHSELLPARILVDRYFPSARGIEVLEAEIASMEEQLVQAAEEQGSEGGPLEDVFDDTGKPDRRALATRLAETAGDEGSKDENEQLEELSSLIAGLADSKTRLRAARLVLDAGLADHYGAILEDDVRTLVVQQKWLQAIHHRVLDEIRGCLDTLVSRLTGLAIRYEKPFPEIVSEAQTMAQRTYGHLQELDTDAARAHQLLTGQVRLPGFGEEWKLVRLGDVATFSKGKGLSKDALDPFESEPCIHYGELFTHYPETVRTVTSRTRGFSGCFRSVANDVLMPTSDVTPDGLAKASCVTADGIILGGDILVIRTSADMIYGPFLSYVIRASRAQILQLVTGTTVFHIYAADMKRFMFLLPEVAEQRAIVSMLSGIDADIEALEARLEKTKDLKKAVAQALLSRRKQLA